MQGHRPVDLGLYCRNASQMRLESARSAATQGTFQTGTPVFRCFAI
jgi:hypothetical protein